MVVISQNPVDVGFASTDRNWKSCTEFGRGGYFYELLDEVKYGGLVAYLTKNEDKNIKNPIARVFIRRYDAEDTHSSRLRTEGRVYGEAGKEFRDFVDEWIQSKQPPQKTKQKYNLVGMDIVDEAKQQVRAYRLLTDLMIKQAQSTNPHLSKLIRIIQDALV